MFGLSKHEIENRIEAKIISDLKEKGQIEVRGIGKLYWTAGSDEVRFVQNPALIKKLKQR